MFGHLHVTATLSTTTFLLYNAARVSTSEALRVTEMPAGGEQAVRLHAAEDEAYSRYTVNGRASIRVHIGLTAFLLRPGLSRFIGIGL